MIRDITLGQYFPGNSPVHRLDPRMKIILTTLFVALLFVVGNFAGYAVAGGLLAAAVAFSGVPVRTVARSIRPLAVIILFTAALNIFYTPGHTIFEWWFLRITAEGLRTAAFMALRIILLIAGTSMLTYTTSPIALTDGLERLMSPLKAVRLPVHEISMMMTIALRFIPTLIDETDKIMNAQKSRGADFESGNLMRRAKALVPILVPLFVSAFRRADELAVAMECRCYRGGEGRTRMKQYSFRAGDYAALSLMAASFAAVIALNGLL